MAYHPAIGKNELSTNVAMFCSKTKFKPRPFIIYTKSSPNVFLFLETFVTMSTWILGPGQKGKKEKENGLFTQF